MKEHQYDNPNCRCDECRNRVERLTHASLDDLSNMLRIEIDTGILRRALDYSKALGLRSKAKLIRMRLEHLITRRVHA